MPVTAAAVEFQDVSFRHPDGTAVLDGLTFSVQPGEVVVESRLGARVVRELRRRGHSVVVSGPWSLARISAVSYDPADGSVRGAANPRGMQGYACGR